MFDELYYEHPVQVRFWDSGEKLFFGGIAYQDYVICGCCGLKCSINKILEEAKRYDNIDVDDAIVEYDWQNLSQKILDE